MILDHEMQGIEVRFLGLFEDHNVDFVHYRYIINCYHHLYEDFYNYA